MAEVPDTQSHESIIQPSTDASNSSEKSQWDKQSAGAKPLTTTDEPVLKKVKLSGPADAEHTEVALKLVSWLHKRVKLVPKTIDFDVDMPVLEKEPQPTFRRGSFKQFSTYRSRAARYTGRVSVDVLLEATSYNSNILHVCCQLDKGSLSSWSVLHDTTEATELFRPRRGRYTRA